MNKIVLLMATALLLMGGLAKGQKKQKEPEPSCYKQCFGKNTIFIFNNLFEINRYDYGQLNLGYTLTKKDVGSPEVKTWRNARQNFTEKQNKKMQNGCLLFATYPIYHIPLFNNRLFIDPSIAETKWPNNNNVSPSLLHWNKSRTSISSLNRYCILATYFTHKPVLLSCK